MRNIILSKLLDVNGAQHKDLDANPRNGYSICCLEQEALNWLVQDPLDNDINLATGTQLYPSIYSKTAPIDLPVTFNTNEHIIYSSHHNTIIITCF